MSCQSHANHPHTHGPSCGHTAVRHAEHIDYVHDGHLHYVHAGHVDEHQLEGAAPCTPQHACGAHAPDHTHGPSCGHEAVPHAGHTDYLVAGHLHHPHGNHCDDHGPVALA